MSENRDVYDAVYILIHGTIQIGFGVLNFTLNILHFFE